MLKLLFVALVFIGYEVNASVFIEPYGGYVWGESSLESLAAPGVESITKATGLGAGLRSGLVLGNTFFVAADATYFNVKIEDEATPVNKEDARQLLLGASAGFVFPAMRIWGGYYFKNEFEYRANDTVPFKRAYLGTAWKAGLSFELFASAHLAFEYFVHDFEKYKGNTGEISLKEAGVAKLDSKSYFVSLTFPIGMNSGKPSGRRR